MSSLLDIRALESAAFRAWPALETGRSQAGSSACPAAIQKSQFNQRLRARCPMTPRPEEALEAPYRRADLPPVWRLTRCARRPTRLLAEAGYRRIDEAWSSGAPRRRFAPIPR
jgi:hypothetical protein